MHCLYGGYNLHRFSDALGLVSTKWFQLVKTCVCESSAAMMFVEVRPFFRLLPQNRSLVSSVGNSYFANIW